MGDSKQQEEKITRARWSNMVSSTKLRTKSSCLMIATTLGVIWSRRSSSGIKKGWGVGNISIWRLWPLLLPSVRRKIDQNWPFLQNFECCSLNVPHSLKNKNSGATVLPGKGEHSTFFQVGVCSPDFRSMGLVN